MLSAPAISSQDQAKQLVFLGVWVSLMMVAIYGLRNDQINPERSGKTVGFLVSKSGSVFFRSETSILWDETGERQGFRDGDHVSTGPDGLAKISLPGGKTIELGGNSQISISRPNETRGFYLISLVRGSMAARDFDRMDVADKRNSRSPKIKILTPSSSIDVSRTDNSLFLFRERGVGIVDVRYASGEISVKSSGGELSLARDIEMVSRVTPDLRVDSQVAVRVRENYQREQKIRKELDKLLGGINTMPEAQKKSARQQISDLKQRLKDLHSDVGTGAPLIATAQFSPSDFYMPRIVSPARGEIAWTLSSLDNRNLNLPVTVLHKSNTLRSSSATWHPLLKLEALGLTGEAIIKQGSSRTGNQEIQLAVGKAIGKAQYSKESPHARAVVQIITGMSPGLINSRDGIRYSARELPIEIRSLRDVKRGAFVAHFKGLGFKSPQGSWFLKQGDAEAKDAEISVTIDSGQRLADLVPALVGSERFLLESTPLETEGVGTYIVKGSQIIGALRVRGGVTLDQLRQLRQMLKARLIFRGHPSIFYREDARGKIVPGKIRAGDSRLYMAVGERQVEVSKDFFRTNKTVEEFVRENASSLYTGNLTIIDHE